MTPSITVLDFGMGNLRSVAKALERAGADVRVEEAPHAGADALVVPGQGAFGSCVTSLGSRMDMIREWIAAERPYLGICLGLQLLFERSEESPLAGAGVFAGDVVRLPGGVKIPHIGWNQIDPNPSSRLFAGVDPGTYFYFVHSFYPVPGDPGVSAATTEYGVEFVCAAERGTVVATQFHPEKSGDAGRLVLENFVRMCDR